MRYGISAASQGPRASDNACAIPKLGVLFLQSGAKWMSRQIFPPLYIFVVFPSNWGSSSSIGAFGYVAGISNCRSNSYFRRLCTYQQVPFHFVPSSFEEI